MPSFHRRGSLLGGDRDPRREGKRKGNSVVLCLVNHEGGEGNVPNAALLPFALRKVKHVILMFQ